MATEHTQTPTLQPTLLAELALAGTHLEHSALAARNLNALALAQSIAAIALQTNDLMRLQIRGLRRAAGLSQGQLARRIGTRANVISQYEIGKRSIAPDFVLRVSAAIGAGAPPLPFPGTPPSVMSQVQTALAGEETRAFEVVASGISMEPSIRHGDKLLVSSDIELEAGRIVVATHDGVWIVKRLTERHGTLVLRSDNADEQLELSAVEIHGVVVELRRTV